MKNNQHCALSNHILEWNIRGGSPSCTTVGQAFPGGSSCFVARVIRGEVNHRIGGHVVWRAAFSASRLVTQLLDLEDEPRWISKAVELELVIVVGGREEAEASDGMEAGR